MDGGSDVTLDTVIDRLMSRPGVSSVTLCTISTGLMIKSTMKDRDESERVAEHFAKVVRATLEAYEALELTEKPELLTFRSGKLEWVLTMADGVYGGPEQSDYFFLVARDPKQLPKPGAATGESK